MRRLRANRPCCGTLKTIQPPEVFVIAPFDRELQPVVEAARRTASTTGRNSRSNGAITNTSGGCIVFSVPQHGLFALNLRMLQFPRRPFGQENPGHGRDWMTNG